MKRSGLSTLVAGAVMTAALSACSTAPGLRETGDMTPLGTPLTMANAPVQFETEGATVTTAAATAIEAPQAVSSQALPSVEAQPAGIPSVPVDGSDDIAAATAAALGTATPAAQAATVPTAPANTTAPAATTAPPVSPSPPAEPATDDEADATSISDENDFRAVSARESIASDKERLARNRQQYEVIQPTAVPQRTGDTGPNIVTYALASSNPVGNKAYSRFAIVIPGRAEKSCARYPSADRAQMAFLEAGGPQRDRLGLDPDGDGYACSWTPARFRQVVDQG
ncbi:hypothetical protein [Chachezhania sediminis]|uniref:hypothetical protein n=1 Tax=Chachezhania sediminis TaxID=2599291 RepID=UPI00131A6FFA|nr:hypothetical protein [Chachezhania sediminis]